MTTPSDLTTLLKNADALAESGQLDPAITALKAGLQHTPAHFTGWLALSRLLYRADYFSEAVQVGQSAEQLDPLGAEFQAIQRAIQSRDYSAATQTAQAMLARVEGHPRAIFTLAHLALAHGHVERAVTLIEDGLSVMPANLTLISMQVGALEQAGRYRAAIEAAERLCQLDRSSNSLWALITVLMRYGQNQAALDACDQLWPKIGDHPGQKSAVELVRAQIYRILGQREASLAAFRACLDLNPRNATAWWGLADLKTHDFSSADRTAITGLMSAPGLNPLERSLAAFALARAEESAGDPETAMASYHRANKLHPAHNFDLKAFHAAVTRITSTVTRDALTAQADMPDNAPRPIFIVGLPRSGSTLVEQILASHSAIEGTMEQPTLPALKQRAHAICATELGGDYLDRLGQVPQRVLTALGQSYLDESALFRAQGAPLFTDKLPHNFEHVGLIHKILPHAVIIDVRRHPMDCGYSLYKQHFTQGTEFSYRLENIGRYYKGYLTLMDHWDRVLPGRVFHLQYEDLVTHPERVVRGLLDHIGLEFEEACLSFHTTQRPVRTASSEQVRQPLSAKAIGASKPLEAELHPLRQALGSQSLDRFKAWY